MKFYQILISMMVMMMIFIDSHQCDLTEDNSESYSDYDSVVERSDNFYPGPADDKFCVDCAVDEVEGLPIGERTRLGLKVLARTVADVSRQVVATVRNLKGQIVPKTRKLLRTAKPIIKETAATLLDRAERGAIELNKVVGEKMSESSISQQERKGNEDRESEEKVEYEDLERPTNLLRTGKARLERLGRQVVSTSRKLYRSIAKKTSEAGKWESKPVLGLSAPLASIFYPFLVSSVLAYFIFSRARFVAVFNYLVYRQLFVMIISALSKIFFGSSNSGLIRAFVESFTFGLFVYSFKFEIMKVITIALVSIATWVLVWVKAGPTNFLGTSYAYDLAEKVHTKKPLSRSEKNLVGSQGKLLEEYASTAGDAGLARRVNQDEFDE